MEVDLEEGEIPLDDDPDWGGDREDTDSEASPVFSLICCALLCLCVDVLFQVPIRSRRELTRAASRHSVTCPACLFAPARKFSDLLFRSASKGEAKNLRLRR